MSNNECLQIKVRGGTIKCYPATDPSNPGVCVMYQPDGTDFEIDIVYIENTQLELNQTLNAEDLRVMVYSDVFSEDYTHHFVVEGEEVDKLMRQIKEEDKLWQKKSGNL